MSYEAFDHEDEMRAKAAAEARADLLRRILVEIDQTIEDDEDHMLHGDTEEDRRVFHYGAKRLKELRIRLIALSPTPLVCAWCGQPDEHHIVTCPVVTELNPTPSEL